MYGHITGGMPPAAAGGGVLASTGSPGLGLAAAAATGMLLLGVLLVRRGRLGTTAPAAEQPPERPGPDRRP
ncbi:hypothetical protein [Kitasatospora cheerisanensis]|uniref:Uncharacterized protein n=1 Tax=Kitasatospora cheerisanensis KCTC 2395 TaxID=1348663 RepID=A0A066Z595_9ACTN|nr:hypothetical protein [Kitasatospora cheerisanensis]KDN85330.1 hypothetical protein KCH_29110 [Kitasatospora cheerisanensis KCTC 2395]